MSRSRPAISVALYAQSIFMWLMNFWSKSELNLVTLMSSTEGSATMSWIRNRMWFHYGFVGNIYCMQSIQIIMPQISLCIQILNYVRQFILIAYFHKTSHDLLVYHVDLKQIWFNFELKFFVLHYLLHFFHRHRHFALPTRVPDWFFQAIYIDIIEEIPSECSQATNYFFSLGNIHNFYAFGLNDGESTVYPGPDKCSRSLFKQN